MLELAAIFIATLSISALTIQLYRLIFGWHGYSYTLIGRPRTTIMMKIGAQQGYLTLSPQAQMGSGEKIRFVSLDTGRRGLRSPWGW